MTRAYLNTRENLAGLARDGRLSGARTAFMLFSRLILFVAWQGVVALILALSGSASPWFDSGAWWPATVTLTNVVGVVLLRACLRAEGMKLRDLYRAGPVTFWKDLLVTLGVFVVAAPLSYLPQVGIANLLWGNGETTAALFFRPLPLWSLVLFVVLLPVTQVFAELPTYFAYAMPRVRALSGRAWWAVATGAFMLAAQHVAFPFVLDARFMLWRFGMFIPLAAWVGLVLYWRPRLLPFVVVGHALLDITLFFYLFPLAV